MCIRDSCVFLGEYPRENEGEKPSLVGMVNECHEVGKDGLDRGSNWCLGFLQALRDWWSGSLRALGGLFPHAITSLAWIQNAINCLLGDIC